MSFERLKNVFKQAKPYAEKIVADTTKGYIFGCVFGAFTPSNQPVTRKMHKNGMTFAKMSAMYSITEIALKEYRQKDDTYNTIVAGAVAGAVGSKDNKVLGSTIFSFYSGVSAVLAKTDSEI